MDETTNSETPKPTIRDYSKQTENARKAREEKRKQLATRGPMEAHKLVERWIAKGLTEVEACQKAGITTEKYIQMRSESPELQASFQRALDDQTQFYEKEARRRSVDGYEEVTRDGEGNIVKRVRKYDSDLLVKMLAARDKRYRTAQKNGGDTNITFDFGAMLEKNRLRAKKLKNVTPDE